MYEWLMELTELELTLAIIVVVETFCIFIACLKWIINRWDNVKIIARMALDKFIEWMFK